MKNLNFYFNLLRLRGLWDKVGALRADLRAPSALPLFFAAAKFLGVATFGLLLTLSCGNLPAVAEEFFFEEEEGPRGALDNQRERLQDLVERLLPVVVPIKSASVVKSELTKYNNDYFYYNETKNIDSVGSGFLISDDGYILTNAHVVDSGDEIFVRYKNREYQTELIGSDPVSDIAVLKINSKEVFPHATLKNDVKLKIGENIVVIGNPYDLGVSVSYGIISALGRNIKGTEYNNLIQTDAAINRGNSGGPMFNLDGDVIGIASVIFSESGDNIGLGFAIPIGDVVNIVEMLKTRGYVQRGYIGIEAIDAGNDILRILGSKKQNGVLVLDVLRGSSAERGGLEVSDIILSFDNKQVKNLGHLNFLIRNSSVGHVASVLVLRNGAAINLKIKINEFSSFKYDKISEKIKNNSADIFDMYLTAIDNNLIEKFGLPEGSYGMMVLDARARGIAELNGIEKNDVVLTANQVKLKTREDLAKVINQAKQEREKNIVLIVKKSKMKKNVLLKLNFGADNF
ncbi:MAG: trypsin-like peptidase domain-containing protein [Rickettsiales bacterium]|nr:trypsin-like peptidase domain-containing protein [Rickettsiales bacterium]